MASPKFYLGRETLNTGIHATCQQAITIFYLSSQLNKIVTLKTKLNFSVCAIMFKFKKKKKEWTEKLRGKNGLHVKLPNALKFVLHHYGKVKCLSWDQKMIPGYAMILTSVPPFHLWNTVNTNSFLCFTRSLWGSRKKT